MQKKTVPEMATALNVAVSTYYSYEQGIRKINIGQVLLLASLLDAIEKDIIIAQLNSCQKAQ